ncbi:tetratricopeptide repeat protein [Chitinimonas lacunae]|uniref:Tetratricopeptide repeat protein n=1 Tax=Chitinimonas lacunae TaxID=1963018 RepID=A0ABV8MLH4_9NEIS
MTLSPDLKQTLARHERYAEADPDNLALRLRLADLYHRAGEFDAALTACQHCLTLAPGDAVARSLHASVLISQHRFEEAERLLAELVQAEPTDAALQHNLGVARFHLRQWEAASQCFDTAARLGLNYGPNLSYLARSLHRLGQTEAAIAVVQRWIELEPGRASQGCLAQFYLEDGQFGAAHENALALLTDHPEDARAHIVAGFACLALHEVELAQQHFDTAIALDCQHELAWHGLGLTHFHQQRYDEAVEAMRTVARLAPDHAGNLVTLGWARLMMRDLAGAQQAFEQALALDRRFGEAHGGLATALALQYQFEQAEQAIKLARRLDPRGFGAELAAAVTLIGRGQKYDAAEIYRQALERSLPGREMGSLLSQLQLRTFPRSDRPRTVH